MIEVQYWLDLWHASGKPIETIMKNDKLDERDYNTSWRSLNHPGTDYIITKVLDPMEDSLGKLSQIVIIEKYESF